MRILMICLTMLASPLLAQDSEPAMTGARINSILLAIDPEAVQRGITTELTIDDVPIMVIVDEPSDRMRAMVPIRSAETMTPEEMQRVMQANFDSALDARYAVARGQLWGVFLHPFKELERDQFISGVAQTVNVALTYGQSYSGGASVFGGGDSSGIFQDLLDELKRKGQEL